MDDIPSGYGIGNADILMAFLYALVDQVAHLDTSDVLLKRNFIGSIGVFCMLFHVVWLALLFHMCLSITLN